MQQIISKYIDYLKVGKNASPYTIRTYQSALAGNNTRGTQKGFFPFLSVSNVKILFCQTLLKSISSA
jgi:site-specific recombinase XerC